MIIGMGLILTNLLGDILNIWVLNEGFEYYSTD